MKVLFVAGVAPIVRDGAASRRLYVEGLGLALEGDDDYIHTDKLEGLKHFGLWPLADAARSCFGTDRWPADIPVPQAVIELEVEDVSAAAAELAAKGHRLLTSVKTEPWGQVVARLLSPEGLLLGLTYTPWMRGG
ncbi:MAG TPA: VOC family protein [bacterium]|nr:VOC family protein [bacterium]